MFRMSIAFDAYEAYVLTQALKTALIEAEDKRAAYEAIKKTHKDNGCGTELIEGMCADQEEFIRAIIDLYSRIDRAEIIKSDGKR